MYKLTDNTKPQTGQTIIRLSDGASMSIPHTDKHHYPAYLDWLAAGNAPALADPVPGVYSIAPETNVVTINTDVLITISAEPNTTITLYAYPIDVTPTVDHELSDCVIDADGHGAVTFTPIEIGEYAVRGKTGELASKIVLIKAVG